MGDFGLDKIHIIDLLIRCVVGVFEEERKDRQDVIINITLHADLSAGCRSDDLEDTVDYKSIKKRILSALDGSSYMLIERMAERISEICLSDPRVKAAEVKVEKPGALRFARSVAVQITRFQKGFDA